MRIPSVPVPIRAVRMKNIGEAVIGAEAIECNSAQLGSLILFVDVAIGREKAIAHPNPDVCIGEYSLELAPFEFDFEKILRFAGGGGHDSFAQRKLKS